MRFGRFELAILRECTFKLDGGALFGVVPKPLWSRVSPADADNRVPLACNLLVISTPAGRILVDTGMGSRWTEKERQRYELDTLVDSASLLKPLGLRNEDVDAVVLSHLHFDHAGGATRLVDGDLVPSFPRARYYVQKGEWEIAHTANARARGSYRLDDYDPLKEHGVLTLIEGDKEILPGVRVHVTGGHTGHHQVVAFESEGENGVYFADIVPTRHHLPPSWVMGYDHYPLASCDAKNVWLERAAKARWLVAFDHEYGIPWGYVERAGDGKFEFVPLTGQALTDSARAASLSP